MQNDNNKTASNSAHACAACKYQRRKCAANCILAPYFPQHRQKQFTNALRLFGVGKLVNAIKNMEPPIQDITMAAIQYQSDARAMDPVGGCYRIIQELQSQIAYHEQELSVILQQLAVCRAQFSDQMMMMMPPQNHPGFQDEIPLSTLTLQDDQEEQEQEQEPDVNDDQKQHVLDLFKEINSDHTR